MTFLIKVDTIFGLAGSCRRKEFFKTNSDILKVSNVMSSIIAKLLLCHEKS